MSEGKVLFEMQIYYAIVNILDGLAEIDEPVPMVKFNYILDDLLAFTGDEIEDIADANDCGGCTTWEEIVNRFKELYKSGDRVRIINIKEKEK